MCSVFERFQAPPPAGWVTALEKDCQFWSHEVSEEDGSRSISHHYPSHHDSTAPTHSRDQAVYRDIHVRTGQSRRGRFEGPNFLPSTEDSHLKKAWDKWREEGLLAAIQTLHENQSPESAASVHARATGCLLALVKRAQNIYGYISPQSQMSVEDIVHCYSGHSNWKECTVRAIALHPRQEYLALAKQNDEIDVRSLASGEHHVVLRDKQQVAVACMQWAPHCDSLLAVGTGTGLLLWHVDATSPTTKFVSTWVRYESSPGHAPITSMSWSPWGNFIASSCPRDSSLLIWDIPLGVGTRVRRGKSGGVASVAWSPDGHRVFAGGVASVFHVWGTENWTNECWQNLKGRCKSGCWSSGGEMLLFALENDPSLYYISFHGSEASSLTTAIKCADLSTCTGPNDDVVVGGEVQSMVWDPTGQRLALTFTKGSPSAELVAVFRTRRNALLEILPGGFVRGLKEEYPAIIAFKPNFSAGALLAVCWSSGRVSFIPLYFHNPTSSSSPAVGSAGLLPPELVATGNPAPLTSPQPISLLGDNESLLRPSLNRTFDSHQGTPLYSVHLSK